MNTNINTVDKTIKSLTSGVAYSQAVPYVFGVHFMNETKMNESYIVPHQLNMYKDKQIEP